MLFLPFVTPISPEDDPRQGVLTRALAREIAERVGAAGEAETVFRPFAHVLDGRRVFGVYGTRWSKADLGRLLEDTPDVDLVVHGDVEVADPLRLTVEVLRAPELEPVAEETFEAPRFDGFRAVEGAVRFVLRTAGLPHEGPEPADFPARAFEPYLCLLRGREAAAALDGWGDTEDPASAFEPFLEALDLEPRMEAAKEGLALLALAAALSGVAPLDAAESALAKLLEIDKRSARGWAALAQVRTAKGDLEGAGDAFRKALEIDPGRAALRFDLGMVYVRQDRAGRATKMLETVKSDPHLGGAALLELGTIRAAKDDLDGAIELWRESVEVDPSRALAWANLGGALAGRGEFDEAEEAFRRGLDAERPSWALHLAYGKYLAQQSRYLDAHAQLGEVLRLRGSEPEAHLYLGRCAAGEGRKTLAIHYLRKALRAGGDVAAKARETLEDLTSVEREEKLLETIEDAVARPAEEQVVILKEILKEAANHAEARLHLAIALMATGRPRSAEGHLKKVLKTLPDDPEALSALATALRARKKLKAAAEVHARVIERAPNHAAFHLNYADTLLRLRRVKEAAREVEIARALEPHHPLLPDFVRSVKLFLSEKPGYDPECKEV